MKEFDISFGYILRDGIRFGNPLIEVETVRSIVPCSFWIIQTKIGEYRAYQYLVGQTRLVKYINRNGAIASWTDWMTYVPTEYNDFVKISEKNYITIKVIKH